MNTPYQCSYFFRQSKGRKTKPAVCLEVKNFQVLCESKQKADIALLKQLCCSLFLLVQDLA